MPDRTPGKRPNSTPAAPTRAPAGERYSTADAALLAHEAVERTRETLWRWPALNRPMQDSSAAAEEFRCRYAELAAAGQRAGDMAHRAVTDWLDALGRAEAEAPRLLEAYDKWHARFEAVNTATALGAPEGTADLDREAVFAEGASLGARLDAWRGLLNRPYSHLLSALERAARALADPRRGPGR